MVNSVIGEHGRVNSRALQNDINAPDMAPLTPPVKATSTMLLRVK
jgi:hypothetical protein